MKDSTLIQKAIAKAAGHSAAAWVNRLDEVGGRLMDEAVRIDANRKRALAYMREALEIIDKAENDEAELTKIVKKSWSSSEIKIAKEGK